MNVQQLLTAKGSFVPIIRSDTTLQDVIERLEIENAGALVVTDDRLKILGIITERDIARGLKTFGRDIFEKPVRQLMTQRVVTCDIREDVMRVLELMDKHQIQYIPITREGSLCGIINMLDLVKNRLAEVEAESKALKAYVAGNG